MILIIQAYKKSFLSFCLPAFALAFLLLISPLAVSAEEIFIDSNVASPTDSPITPGQTSFTPASENANPGTPPNPDEVQEGATEQTGQGPNDANADTDTEIFNKGDEKKEAPKKRTAKDKQNQTQTQSQSMSQSMISTSQSGEGLKFQLPTHPQATVDQSTGALIYEYPISLPEGRAGMTPELSLTYNSRNASKPDSYVGLGWETSIPYIVREPVKGTNNLYAKAFFSSSLSGNLIATTDTTSSQYTIYRPETDNGDYLKYKYENNNTWTATGKDGKTYTFGDTSASRQDKPSDTAKVYKWMISKITDANGNEIQYTYIKDRGQIYPSQILYTYHTSAPAAHSVDFLYTTPADFGSTLYNAGFAVSTLKLLKTIVVTTTVMSETATHTYTLRHSSPQFLKNKLLDSITKIDSLPTVNFFQNFDDTTSFSYSEKVPGWKQDTHTLQNYMPDDPGMLKNIFSADFDRNGYPDILISGRDNAFKWHRKLMMNTGTAFTESADAWSLPAGNPGNNFAIADLDGDKLPDLHSRNSDFKTVYINTGSSFLLDTSGNWYIPSYVAESESCGPNVGDNLSYNTNTFLYDINNDGKNDILYFGGADNFKVYLNNGAGWTPSSAYAFTINPGSNYNFADDCNSSTSTNNFQALIDMNGDGLADFVHQRYGTYLNTGAGFAYSSAYSLNIYDMRRTGLADINGDSLIDYVAVNTYSGGGLCLRVYMNNGEGFTMVNPSATSNCTDTNIWNAGDLKYATLNGNQWGKLLDLNADSLPDIISMGQDGSTGKIESFNDQRNAWVDNSATSDPWFPLVHPSLGIFLDINADGVLDFTTPILKIGGINYPSKVHMGKSSVPNRLVEISSPLGADTLVDYGTEPTDYNDTSISPIPVVKKITTQNIGSGQPSMATQYSYAGGSYVADPATGQKRFAGFHKVTALESGADLSPLRITETYYHQANGSDDATNEPADTSLSLIGKPYYSVVKDPSSILKKEIWSKYGEHSLAVEPATGRLSNFIYPAETVTKTTETGATTGTADVYAYDTTLGELTELSNMGFVDVASDGSYSDISGDTRYKFIEYSYNAGKTIVKPKRIDVRKTPSLSDTIARTNLYYDNKSYGAIGSFGNLTKETKWISGNGSVVASTLYAYDIYGNILTITNPRGAINTYAYDITNSQIASETNHLNHITTYEYMAGYLKKKTDPNGRITSYGYSSKGWPYSTTIANTGGSQRILQWLEGGKGAWAIHSSKKLVNIRNDESWQVMDNLGRPVRAIRLKTNHTTGANGGLYLKEVKSYDALGREIARSIPYGTPSYGDWSDLLATNVPSDLVATTSYDIFNRPLSITDALGATTLAYAGPEITTTDALDNQKSAKYDAYGNIIQVKEYNDGDVYTTNYNYDTRDLLTGITDALGNVRSFAYNNAGWLTSSQDLHAPADTTYGSSSFTYDFNGNQLVETQPNGVKITRAYDMLDRPLSVDSSSTAQTDYAFAYDSCTNGKGRLCQVSGILPNSVTLNKSYVYGISGAPTSVSLTTLGNTYTTLYAYNYSDEISKTTYPDGTIVRTTFGDWALPEKTYITLPGGSETLYAAATYHHTGKPSTIAITNGPIIANTYDDAKLYRKTNMAAVQGENLLQSYAYTYDSVNNIIQIAEPGLTKTYTYDDLYRLTGAVHAPLGEEARITYNYAYNAIGNITNGRNLAYAYSGAGKTNPHAVTSIGANKYAYDNNGNLISAPNLTITNNWQNQPSLIVVNGTKNINAYYDESGERFIYQTPTNTEVQVDETYLVRNSVPEITIKQGGIPVGTVSNGNIYSTIADHLGTPVKQINSSGAVAENIAYDPFGKIVSQAGTLNTKRGYTGHEEDIDTGMVYAEARYYNPGTMRFNQQDPSHIYLGSQNFKNLIGTERKNILLDPQQLNSYSYVRNNPITLSDPSGMSLINYVPNNGKIGEYYSEGTIEGTYYGTPIYSNGYPGHGEKNKYQCPDFVKRFVYNKDNVDLSGLGNGGKYGIQAKYDSKMKNQPGSFTVYQNGSTELPRDNDIISWNNTEGGPGHVGVVVYINFDSKSGTGTLLTAEQNQSARTGLHTQKITSSTENGVTSYTIQPKNNTTKRIPYAFARYNSPTKNTLPK